MAAPSIRYLLPIPSPRQQLLRTTDSDDSDDAAEAETHRVEVYEQAKPLVHSHSNAATKTLGKMLNDPELMRQRLQFMAVCEEMAARFDPQARQAHTIALPAVKQLLVFFDLRVDDAPYRQWEQRLPECTSQISTLMLSQALLLWFSERFIIEHFMKLTERPAADQNAYDMQRGGRTGSGSSKPATLLGKAQSVPYLHPFERLKQQHAVAAAFDYEKAASQPPRIEKTTGETNSLKSRLVIQATQELRRKTKILSRLDAASLSPPLSPQARAKKLARNVLQRCSTHALAPSNRVRVSQSLSQIRQQKVQQALAKQTRAHNTETAKAFSASIAMISRHIQNEELRDLRELHRERKAELADNRKHWGRVHKAHCRALADERKQQHLRDVHAMKVVAREELELVRNYLGLRQDMLRGGKQPFVLSESSSTLFPLPPELLAAKATAKSGWQKQELIKAEREHFEHARSLQLLDYVYDKKRAVTEALKPKADAALVEVDLVPDEKSVAAVAELPSLATLWELLREQGCDVSAFLPPTNSPPAARRYFGFVLPAPLPPFLSSEQR
ncbi:hypothetical protein PybrP1_002111 [[Pythium] brassicae (nom. inval.)]|nr:hypothetical protein PybrP1_002111 [[Pythium] brassicae (nom. inval.)]